MRACTDERGKDRLADTLRLIKQDQAIYKDLMIMSQQGTPLEQCFPAVAKTYPLGIESVRQVYRQYQRQVDELLGKPPSRSVRKTVEDITAHLGAPVPGWNQWNRPGDATSWQEALQRLEAMAQRLEVMIGM